MNAEIRFRLTQNDLSLQQQRSHQRFREVVASGRNAFSRALRSTILPSFFLVALMLFLNGNSRQDKWLVISTGAVGLALAIGISSLDTRKFLRSAAAQSQSQRVRLSESHLEIILGEISTIAPLATITDVAESVGHMVITWKDGFEFLIPLHAFDSAEMTSAWFESLSPAVEIPAL
jgi:hypothetical protein